MAALAQDNRLDVFRLLVRAGDKGCRRARSPSALGLAPNTLSFHFDRLRQAGLVTCTRDGRSLIYAAKYDTMNALLGYLTANCCAGVRAESADSLRPARPQSQEIKGIGMSMPSNLELPVAVIGAGPVGLAAAAHLVTRGLPVKLYEAGETVAAHVRSWGHVRLFSPWGFNTDTAARALLRQHGWQAPPVDVLPTGSDLYAAYLQPLAQTPELDAVIETGARVRAVSRRASTRSSAATAPPIRSR